MEPFTALASDSHIKEDNGSNVEPPSSPHHPKVIARWDPVNSHSLVMGEALEFKPSIEEFEDTLAYIEKIRPVAEFFGICKIVPPSNWSPPCRLKEKSIWENTKFSTRIQNVDLLQNRGPMNKKKKKKKPKSQKRKRKRNSRNVSSNETTKEEKFGFNSGPDFTLEEFEKYAQYFKASYFEGKEALPSIEEIEGEYWRIVEKPTDEVEVFYGADLDNKVLGSGFYKSGIDHQYIAPGWNLNNLPRLPSSLLSFEESDISGILVPWVYIGMCFSSFCWHVEDHNLYSINYHHFGEPKVWYGVPGSHATNLEKLMREYLPDLFKEQPDLLNEMVTQFSPRILKAQGVPIRRLVQNAGEFVITFPRAYHSGFNSGFNCAEAVNFAPVDWLPDGLTAVELYSHEKHRTSMSHDKLLLGAAQEAVKSLWEKKSSWERFCGKYGTLTVALRTRLWMEKERIEALGNSFKLLKMDKEFDSDREKDCNLCLYDLHLTASGCKKCSLGKFACTKHAQNLCWCDGIGKDRFILLRYSINELSSLVRALEGESEDLKIWASKVNEELEKLQKKEAFDLNVDLHIDDSVELVNVGVLVIGKLWCNNNAIFPKGFKSRVKFYNVRDPRNMSYYVSEVVDGGLMGPFFRVTLEESQDCSFLDGSAQKCWEMVLENVNKELSKLNQETLKNIDGQGMFGFLSPSIIQAIEALDPGHRLAEYWESRA